MPAANPERFPAMAGWRCLAGRRHLSVLRAATAPDKADRPWRTWLAGVGARLRRAADWRPLHFGSALGPRFSAVVAGRAPRPAVAPDGCRSGHAPETGHRR